MIQEITRKESTRDLVRSFSLMKETQMELEIFKRKFLIPYLDLYNISSDLVELIAKSTITKDEVEAISNNYNRNKIKLSSFYKNIL